MVTHGSSSAITGVVATNEKLCSVTKILKTLGVQINLAFDLHSHSVLPLEREIKDSINFQPSPANAVCQILEDTGVQELPVPGLDNQCLENLGSSELGADCGVQGVKWQESEKLGNFLQHYPERNFLLAQDLVTKVEEESIEDLLEDSDDHEQAQNTLLECTLCRKTFHLPEELLGHQEECRERNITVGLQET